MDAPGLLDTRSAHFFAIAYASAGIAPTAVANESINRRFTSCTASRVSFSNVRSDEYRASRSASVRGMNVPVGVKEPWGRYTDEGFRRFPVELTAPVGYARADE